MPEIRLSGTIPVTVVVYVNEEEENGSVERVIAHDEEFSFAKGEDETLTPELRQLALEVADASPWPAWDWG